MLKKRYKLSWLIKWWLRHFTFVGEYITFSEAGQVKMFWNIITWYMFLSRSHYVEINWFPHKLESAMFIILAPENLVHTKVITFYNNEPRDIIQFGNPACAYKQIDGTIYEICKDSSAE